MPTAVGDNIIISGTEVNSYPAITQLSNGNSVIVHGTPASGFRGIFAQIVGPDDEPIGDPIFVPTTFLGTQNFATIAALPGGFVVTWQSGANGMAEIFAQRFDLDGTPVGSEIPVNTTTADGQFEPQVVALSGGGFVVVWTDTSSGSQVRGQVFNASGVAMGSEFAVDAGSASQSAPDIAALDGGGFFVTWTAVDTSGPEGGNDGVRGRVFNAAGQALDDAFVVNTTTAQNQDESSIVQLEGGNVLVVWRSGGGESGPFTLQGQLYTAAGVAVGAEMDLATATSSIGTPEIAALATGGFAMTWEVGTASVYAQEFEANGDPVGDAFRVSEAQFHRIGSSTIIATDDGFQVVWTGFTFASSFAVFGLQRYNDTGPSNVPTPSHDTLTGTEGDDDIDALSGNDTIDGLGGNDRLDGGPGDDVIDAGAGDDIIIGSAGDDIIDGGFGRDLIDYSDAAVPITLLLQFPNPQETGLGEIRITGVEDAIGSAFDDYIIGNSSSNSLWGGDGDDQINGQTGDDTIYGEMGDDELNGHANNDFLLGGEGDDTLISEGGDNRLAGGPGIDTAIFVFNMADYDITTNGAVTTIASTLFGSGEGTAILTGVEFVQFGDQTIGLSPGGPEMVNFGADPATYMSGIRDFDGNDLGAAGSWVLIGQVDIQGDGDLEYIYTNETNGRWATIGPASNGDVYFSDYSWGGDTRVVGIYIDPLVESGDVEAGSDHDSQRRFQNDLFIGNIAGILGADDYDGDGLQEVYFSLTDGTAYLHAYMHADGNIRYANYQNQQQVIDYLTDNGYSSDAWDGWFPEAAGLIVAQDDFVAA